MSDDDVKLREALKAAQQIVDTLATIKGKRLAIAFRDDATAQHVGLIIENAAKVSRALLTRPNSSSPDEDEAKGMSPAVCRAMARFWQKMAERRETEARAAHNPDSPKPLAKVPE